MENNIKGNIETIRLKQTFQEVYEVKNDVCPICDKKFIAMMPIYKHKDKAYHLSCYLEFSGNNI